MAYEKLMAEVGALGFPWAYRSFPVNPNVEPPKPPYCIILATYNNDIMADNQNYKGRVNHQLELYTDFRHPPSEQLIENLLKRLRIPYGKSTAFIDSERLHQVVYQIQLLEE